MDPDQALRYGVFQALDGNLTLTVDGSGSNVPVWDGKAMQQDAGIYVILGSQTRQDKSTHNGFIWTATFLVDIIYKAESSVSKDVLDDIGGQVENILMPDVHAVGIVAQSGYQFLNLRLQNSDFLDLTISTTKSIIRKLMTFSLTINKL